MKPEETRVLYAECDFFRISLSNKKQKEINK